MKEKWKDGFRHGETVESEIKYGRFRLSVHHYIGCGETWFASCHSLFSQKQLEAETMDQAKAEATGLLRPLLQNALDAMDTADEEPKCCCKIPGIDPYCPVHK